MTPLDTSAHQNTMPMRKNGLENCSRVSRLAPNRLRRKRLTVSLPLPLLERLRNAIYWTKNRTLAQLIGDSVEDALAEMEKANGGSFPTRLEPLKPGRPPRVRALSRSFVPSHPLRSQDDVACGLQ